MTLVINGVPIEIKATAQMSAISQSAYDALTDEKKADGLYVITSDDGTKLSVNGTVVEVGGATSSAAYLVKAPIGTIVIWSGTADNIPAGWALCDGQDGRPDLRGKFVLGASTEHPVGETGGSEEVTLTADQMPSHSHSYSTYNGARNSFQYYDDANNVALIGPNVTNKTSSTGDSQPHNNMPPYYALCYIIKVTADPADGVTQEEFQTALAGKQDTITAGDGLSKEGDTLSVDNPIQGILTQAEFDALTEEQKASGTYFVDDGELLQGITIEDYDTDDGWHVRKWSDGYIEQFISVSQKVTNFITIDPMRYTQPYVNPIVYPIPFVKFLGISVDYCANKNRIMTPTWYRQEGMQDRFLTQTPNICLLGYDDGLLNIEVTYLIRVYGFWK